MKTAIAYIRVSRITENSSIHSVDTQRSMIESYAAKNGIEVLEWFIDENVSGGKKDRENLKRAVELAKRTKSYLMVRSLSRLSRRASECLRLLSECSVIDTTLGMECDDKVMAIMALNAQWEREACSVRQKQTIAYLRKSNPDRTFGNPTALIRGREVSARRRAALADEWAWEHREFFQYDEPLQDTANRLMRLGIKTRRGNDNWSPNTIRAVKMRLEAISQNDYNENNELR
jgi:DNA invertase Pin-like site-specific DNA recombinase